MKLGLAAFVLTAGLQAVGCVPVHLQETPAIRGTVTSTVNRTPISGANVLFQAFPEARTVTSSAGSFQLAAISKWQFIPLGSDQNPVQRLVVSALGYETQDLAVHLGGPTEYSIALAPTAIQ